MTPLRSFFFAALILYAADLAAQGVPLTTPPPTVRHVIIVSVDGLMPAAYASPDAHGLDIPTLREMVRQGAWSEGARSVFPTLTYPAHTSIATGVNPAAHGIVSNLAWDPLGKNQTGWRWYAADIRAPALWDAALARDLSAAMVWWPATVGARATVLVPEIWRSGTEEDLKLVRALSTPGILENVSTRFPNFATGFTPPAVKDESLGDIAVHLIDIRRPNLLMLHLPQVDYATHRAGPFSAGAIAAVENADRQIARLIQAAKNAGTWNETVLVVVSDHGFARISRSVKPGVLLPKKGLVTLDSRGRVTNWKATVAGSGGYLYVYVKEPQDTETRRALLEIFLPLMNNPASGIRRVYKQEEIRVKGGDPSAFLALEGAGGFELADGYRGNYMSAAAFAATHGYDPERPEMLAALLIYGPAIAPGKIEGARLIDVAPTVARWLGLKLDQAEGTALPVALRAPAR
ncbi:MAG TPA: ectonucleotide pyrophosphatase/phosphodiesterase [Candidatus Binatia bacterium]|jgi:predicted AlkP superfamily pyrophosphatase or phosphodiesterase